MSKSLKFVFTFIHPSFLEILKYYLVQDIDISMILSRDLFDKVKNEYPEELQKTLSNNGVKLYVYNKDIKVSSLSINDDCFVLRLLFANNEFSSKTGILLSP